MRLIIIIIVGLTFWTCKSNNDDFDPFDNEFLFHDKIDIADYDSIFIDGGYWALQKSKSGLESFYILQQPSYFFMKDKIVGKGFRLVVDSIEMTDCNSKFYDSYDDANDMLKKLFDRNPIDFEKVKARLLRLGVIDIKMLSDSIVPFKLEITNLERKTFKARLEADCNFEGHVIRHIDFTNLKDDLPDK
jgi:hypothetical protein